VEDFSVNRFRTLEASNVTERVREFRAMTAFEAHMDGHRV
jgi:hypothetical protein